MDFVDLHVSLREGKGKELNKKLRDKGLVPAVVYKSGEDSILLKIDRKNLLNALHSEAGENAVIKLCIEGVAKKKERTVIIKEIQKEPIKDEVLHVDFQEISLTETLKVKISITSKGEAIGVKQDQGMLQHILWEVECECLPANIPEKIEVDISSLKIGESMHIKDIPSLEGVKILGDPEDVVFSIEHPKTVEEVTAAESPEGEAQEPEVIKEKKEKPEEEAVEAVEKSAEEKKPEKKE